MELVLSGVWLFIVAWLIARAIGQRGQFDRLEPFDAPVRENATVVVIVPARDEEANIGRCLRSLVQQTYPVALTRILVIDDQSRDRTCEIVASLARENRQIQLLHSPPLPPGWTGKSHACATGYASAPASEWLCFIDADVWVQPALIVSAVAYAGREDLDLLSLSPRQEFKSFAERLIMPCGFYLLAFCQDLRRVQSSHSATATVTGQCMLVRRSAYDTVGGHAAVRAAICEDLALGLLIKRLRGRVRLLDGHRLLSTRMYTGWGELWIGISKNLVEMLGGQGRTIAIAAVATVLAWAAFLIPAFDAFGCVNNAPGACIALVPATIASAAAISLHIAGTAFFHIPPWYGLLFPFGYTAGSLIALDSLRRRWTGTVRWKGRTL